MSLVNAETGELIEPLVREEAERLTTRIALKLDAMADTYAGVMPLIREAIDRQAHAALGYRSPGDYIQDRFGGSLGKLGVEIRREVVRELTDAGMSTRAIAPVVGISHEQVRKDARVNHLTPDPHPQAEDAPAPVQAVEPPSPRPAVVGIDGKTYTPRGRQAQRDDAEVVLNRVHSLADQAAREAAKLTPAQIARVTQKADLWTVGLRESVETLQGLLTSLTEEK